MSQRLQTIGRGVFQFGLFIYLFFTILTTILTTAFRQFLASNMMSAATIQPDTIL